MVEMTWTSCLKVYVMGLTVRTAAKRGVERGGGVAMAAAAACVCCSYLEVRCAVLPD